MKKHYISPSLLCVSLASTQLIAVSLDSKTPTNISDLTNGGSAVSGDEAGVRGYSFSVWDDDWSN